MDRLVSPKIGFLKVVPAMVSTLLQRDCPKKAVTKATISKEIISKETFSQESIAKETVPRRLFRGSYSMDIIPRGLFQGD